MPWFSSHSFLNEYIRRNKCRRILEIGVLKGENAKTMIKVAITNFPPRDVEYFGFDFFSGSRYDKVKRKLEKTGCKIRLIKGNTLITLPKAVKTLPKMDLIFIDGGKSYRETKSDWEQSRRLMHKETGIFIHNYGLSGVKRMVDSIFRDDYQVEIIRIPYDADTAMIKKKV